MTTPSIQYNTMYLIFQISLISSLNVREHISQPNSTTGKIIVLLILILSFCQLKEYNCAQSFPHIHLIVRNCLACSGPGLEPNRVQI